MLRSAAVVGTGLIGTSIALALSAKGVAVYLIDQEPMAARTAAAMGAGRAEEPAEAVDLAILAVPPHGTGHHPRGGTEARARPSLYGRGQRQGAPHDGHRGAGM